MPAARRQVVLLSGAPPASSTPALLPVTPHTHAHLARAASCPLPVESRFGGTEALSDDLVLSQRLGERDLRRLYGHQDRSLVGFVRKPTAAQLRRTHAHINSRTSAFQGQEKQLKIRG